MKRNPADFIRRLFAPVRGPSVRGVAGERMQLSVIPNSTCCGSYLRPAPIHCPSASRCLSVLPGFGDLNSGVFRVNI